jgi:hypothetical protein
MATLFALASYFALQALKDLASRVLGLGV